MKCSVYNHDCSTLLHEVELVPKCTGHADIFCPHQFRRELMKDKDTCNKCGSCLKCHEGHPCMQCPIGGPHEWCMFDEERDVIADDQRVPTKTMLPPVSCSRIRCTVSLATKKWPVALTSRARRHSSAARSSISPTVATPALDTTTSTPP